MKLFGGLLLTALLFALPIRADQIVDYTLSVVDAPGQIGNFSWTIASDGFVVQIPPTFDSHGNCIENCDANQFTNFMSVSPPSDGQGCGISSVFMEPGYALTTFFSPLCDGKYDSTSAGVLPDPPNQFGTWTWQGTSPDGTQNFVTLTIADPPGAPVPEPGTLGMLGIGLLGLAVALVGAGNFIVSDALFDLFQLALIPCPETR